MRKRTAQLDISFILCGSMRKRRLEYEVNEKMNILTDKMRIGQDIDDREKVSILALAFAAPWSDTSLLDTPCLVGIPSDMDQFTTLASLHILFSERFSDPVIVRLGMIFDLVRWICSPPAASTF